jgi:hypothetical protein
VKIDELIPSAEWRKVLLKKENFWCSWYWNLSWSYRVEESRFNAGIDK